MLDCKPEPMDVDAPRAWAEALAARSELVCGVPVRKVPGARGPGAFGRAEPRASGNCTRPRGTDVAPDAGALPLRANDHVTTYPVRPRLVADVSGPTE